MKNPLLSFILLLAKTLIYLFNFLVKNKYSVEQLIEELDAACRRKGISGLQDRVDALKVMLTPQEAFLQKRKVFPYFYGVERYLDATSREKGTYYRRKALGRTVESAPELELELELELEEDAVLEVVRRQLSALNNEIASLRKRVAASLARMDEMETERSDV